MTLAINSLRQDLVRRNFSRHADEYDRHARIQKIVATKLLRCLPSAAGQGQCLEVGCGTGILSQLFLERHPAASLILSDIAHGMSCQIAQAFPGRPVVDADAAQLPFMAERFDLVLSSSVYQWVDPLPQAVAEIQRILRPGGMLVLALFGEQTLFELRQSHAEALDGGISHGQSFPGCQQLRNALADNFEVELLEKSYEIEWHDDVPQLLRSLKAIGAQNASRHRPGGLGSRQLMQRMYAHYQRNFGIGNRIPATYEVIYLRAKKKVAVQQAVEKLSALRLLG